MLVDFLIRIKNASLVRKNMLVVPYSKVSLCLAKLLLKEGYLAKVEVSQTATNPKSLSIELKYHGRKPAVSGVKIISKPSLRIFTPVGKIKPVLGGKGKLILSTPKGLTTGEEAKKKNLGGEVICEIW